MTEVCRIPCSIRAASSDRKYEFQHSFGEVIKDYNEIFRCRPVSGCVLMKFKVTNGISIAEIHQLFAVFKGRNNVLFLTGAFGFCALLSEVRSLRCHYLMRLSFLLVLQISL
jgi:hypothetical protein